MSIDGHSTFGPAPSAPKPKPAKGKKKKSKAEESVEENESVDDAGDDKVDG